VLEAGLVVSTPQCGSHVALSLSLSVMPSKKSSRSPTKGTSTSHQAAMPPSGSASWPDTDINTLLDLAISHKASAGQGMNFRAPFWNGVAAALANPSKGGPKTPKGCKDKYKRVSNSWPKY